MCINSKRTPVPFGRCGASSEKIGSWDMQKKWAYHFSFRTRMGTILRPRPDTTVYLDLESAADLDGVLVSR